MGLPYAMLGRMPSNAAAPQDPFERALLAVIRDAMTDRDVIPAELARRTGVSESQVSNLFNGKRTLRFGQFVAICKALGVPASIMTARAEGREHEFGGGDSE